MSLGNWTLLKLHGHLAAITARLWLAVHCETARARALLEIDLYKPST